MVVHSVVTMAVHASELAMEECNVSVEQATWDADVKHKVTIMYMYTTWYLLLYMYYKVSISLSYSNRACYTWWYRVVIV